MLRTAQASTYIKVPPGLAFAVLADYESYRDWMPDVLESRLLAAEGDVAIAQLVAPEFGTGKFLLEFVGSAPDWLKYKQVDRYRRGGLSGRWELEEVDSGSGVVVRAVLSLRSGFLKFGVRRHLRHVLKGTLEALASRSLRLAAHGHAGAGLGKRKILELVRTEESLRLELDGKVYHLLRQTRGEAN